MIFFGDNGTIPVTALLDADGNQLLETVNLMSLSCQSSKQFAQHTLENAENISDHVFDLQDRVNLTVILNPDDYQPVYQEIKNLFNDLTEFIIQTKVETYTGMYLEALPHEESARMIDTISIQLPFVQQMTAAAEVVGLPPESVANQSDANSVDVGNKRPQSSGTLLSQLFGGAL